MPQYVKMKITPNKIQPSTDWYVGHAGERELMERLGNSHKLLNTATELEHIWPATAVTGKDVKVKYVFLTVESQDRPLRVPITEEVIVYRKQNTPAEDRALHYAWATQRLTNEMMSTFATRPSDWLRKLADEYDKHWNADRRIARALDWSDARFLEHQAKFAVWSQVNRTLENLQKRWPQVDVNIMTAVAVVMSERDKATYPSPISRSTNGFGNMLDDLDRWAWAEFADGLRWSSSPEMLAEELKKFDGKEPTDGA
jgi:hypothetical protein